MSRYAVLLDVHDRDLRPIGLVTEHEHAVLVHFAVPLGLKSEYREPYDVMEPDGTTVRYEPGTDEYFNSVINTLSRGFAVNEIAEAPVDQIDLETIGELYLRKVLQPRARHAASYAPRFYGGGTYVETPARAQRERVAPAVDAESMLCVAA